MFINIMLLNHEKKGSFIMDNIVSIFKDKKLKLTPQRLAVYQFLKSTDEHPSAETIYKGLQENYPTMSLATVYKALKTLVEVNLVQEINIGEGNFRYDGNPNEHAHIQCINCSKVEDLHHVEFPDLNKLVEEKTNYNIKWNKLFFYGICKHCQ